MTCGSSRPGTRHPLGELGTGTIFGERSLLLDQPERLPSLPRPVHLLVLNRDMFLQLLTENLDSERGLVSQILQHYEP